MSAEKTFVNASGNGTASFGDRSIFCEFITAAVVSIINNRASSQAAELCHEELMQLSFDRFLLAEHDVVKSALGLCEGVSSEYRKESITLHVEILATLGPERACFRELLKAEDPILVERWTFRVDSKASSERGRPKRPDFLPCLHGLVRSIIAVLHLLPMMQIVQKRRKIVKVSTRICVDNPMEFPPNVAQKEQTWGFAPIAGDLFVLTSEVKYLSRELLEYTHVEVDQLQSQGLLDDSIIDDVDMLPHRGGSSAFSPSLSSTRMSEEMRIKGKQPVESSRASSKAIAVPRTSTDLYENRSYAGSSSWKGSRYSRRSSDDREDETGGEEFRPTSLPSGTPPTHTSHFGSLGSGKKIKRKTVSRESLLTQQLRAAGSSESPASSKQSFVDNLEDPLAGKTSSPMPSSLPARLCSPPNMFKAPPLSSAHQPWMHQTPIQAGTVNAFRDKSVADVALSTHGSSGSLRGAGSSLPDSHTALHNIGDEGLDAIADVVPPGLPLQRSLETEKAFDVEVNRGQNMADPDMLSHSSDITYRPGTSFDTSISLDSNRIRQDVLDQHKVYSIISERIGAVALLVEDKLRFKRLTRAAREFNNKLSTSSTSQGPA